MADEVEKAAQDSWAEVLFDPNADKITLLFDGMSGHEELGRPFLFHVRLSSGKIQDKISKLVGQSCIVWLAQSAQNAVDTYFHGIITRILSVGIVAGAHRYTAEVRPWFWLLSRQVETRIFQKKSPFKIITEEIFKKEGFKYDDKRKANAGDVELEYCVQYNETTFDFVMRLMEQYGLYYYFEYAKDGHTLHITDDPNSHDALSDPIKFDYDQTGFRTIKDHIWQWTTDTSLQSGKVTYRDYNFTTPAADLTAKAVNPAQHDHADYEVYEYPGPYSEAADGQKLTDIHMQAITMHRTVIEGTTNSRKIRPGVKFTLSDHPDKAANKEYLVISTDFHLGMAEGSQDLTEGGETVDTYHATFRAIPGDTHYRLDRLTQRPIIKGPQTAKVVCKSGEEIDTDEYGRVLVWFHWDRADGVDDDKRTCRIRVAQGMAGNAWGTMFIPRVDQEVIVEFLEGNPDRPLITGTVYNATNKVPYDLPANQTRTTIKTNSSKGGGGFNELRFEDKKDSEEIFFQAQKDYNKVVLNNETVKIKKDTTTTVEEGNRSVAVSKGDDTHKVDTGKRTTTIKGNDALTVSSGTHSVDVSAGESKITAATGITLTVGGNSAKIDTSSITLTVGGTSVKLDASGVTLSGPKITITGNANVAVSAPMIALN